MTLFCSPAAEPLKIVDLPNDILGNIMSHLYGLAEQHDAHDIFLSTPTEDIKNVRLSCHNLSAPASRYLIEHVRVDVSLSSLSRFEKICEHPLIRHGVLGVEFCLAQYDDRFDSGIEGFKRFIRYHQYDLTFPWDSTPEVEHKARAVSQCWGTYLGILQAEGQALLGSFDEQFTSIQEFKNEWDTGYNGALLEGYSLYRSHLHEQTSLQHDGFVARVSASMAKLPRAKHLKLTDWDTGRWGNQPGGFEYARCRLDPSSNDSIVESLAKCRFPFKEIRGNTLLPLIPSLICTGTGITSLTIQISPSMHSCIALSPSTSHEAELNSSLRNLRSFRFENYGTSTTNPWDEAPAVQPLGRFLNACLISDNLESLTIHAKIQLPSLEESLFSPRFWPKLRSAVLGILPASADDLDVLTRSLSSQPEGSLSLSSVYLYCGGTWARILDMMRDRRIHASLGSQCGAEFETDPTMANGVFCKSRKDRDSFFPSFAECYVHGEDMPNPFLEPPGQEISDSSFEPVPDSENNEEVEEVSDFQG